MLLGNTLPSVYVTLSKSKILYSLVCLLCVVKYAHMHTHTQRHAHSFTHIRATWCFPIGQFLCVATKDFEQPSKSKLDPSAIKGIRGTLERWDAIRPTSPFPAQRAVGWAWHGRYSWKTHTYPGSSIFHPCYGNIDIGRQTDDIGYVMMQLKQEPLYYYWQAGLFSPHFRRQIWFGSHAQTSRESALVIKEFILSYQCCFRFICPRTLLEE